MAERNLKDIQVKELCERAGLSKAVFYKHYKDTDAVLYEMEQEQLDRFRVLLSEKKESAALLQDILDSFEKAKELFRVGNDGLLPERFKAGLIAIAKEYGLRGWKEKLPQADARKAELAFEGLLAGALQIAQSADGKNDREKVTDTITDLIEVYKKACRRPGTKAHQRRYGMDPYRNDDPAACMHHAV